jgi:hypothetical protein
MSKGVKSYFHLIHTMLGALAEEGVEVDIKRVPVSHTPYVRVRSEDFDALDRLRLAFLREVGLRGFAVTPGGGHLRKDSEKGFFLMDIPRIWQGEGWATAVMDASLDGPYPCEQMLVDRPIDFAAERKAFAAAVESNRRSREDNASRRSGTFASAVDMDANRVAVEDIAYTGGRRNKSSEAFAGSVKEALISASGGRFEFATLQSEFAPAPFIRARMDADYDDMHAVRIRFLETMKADGFVQSSPGILSKTSESGNFYISLGCIAASEKGDAFIDVEPYGPVKKTLSYCGVQMIERLERLLFEARRLNHPRRDEDGPSPPGP